MKILFTSLKGGVGTSTCAVNVGMSLAKNGQRTLVFDGDYKCGSDLIIGGMWGMNVFTMKEAENGNCRVKQVIVQHPKELNFYILPSLGCSNEQFLAKALKEVDGLFDYIICDEVAQDLCDRAVVITDTTTPSIKCADTRLCELRDNGLKNVALAVTKVNGGLLYDGKILPPKEIAEQLHAQLAAIIPEDLSLPLEKIKPQTVKSYHNFACFLQGKSFKNVQITKPYMGVNGMLKRKLRDFV
jgi:septum formation inhibitor-activating ATPase MinD